MAEWTLTKVATGEQKSLSEWGLANPVVTKQSTYADTLTADSPGRAFDADPLFSYGDIVSLKTPTGQQFFYGRCVLPGTSTNPNAEDHRYEFGGPWHWLDQLEYQQVWLTVLGVVQLAEYSPHVFLNWLNRSHYSAGAFISAVIDYAIAQGAPVQRGTVEGDSFPPIREAENITCGQAIREMLKFLPRHVAWFDHSTTPPTFHCRARANLTAVTMPIGEGAGRIEASDILPRDDLIRPSVVLVFRFLGSYNGVPSLAVNRDAYPLAATGRELNALTATVNLQGQVIDGVEAEIECAAIEATSLEWWKKVVPELTVDTRIRVNAIVSGSLKRRQIINGELQASGTNHQSYLANGTIAPWMIDGSTPLTAAKEYFSVEVDIDVLVDGEVVYSDLNHRIGVELTTTNADPGVVALATASTIESADPLPVGLAQFLYQALAERQWQGFGSTVEAEVSGLIGVGNALNISGGRAEWANMRALIQEATYDIDQGRTRVQFGPPGFFSVGDLVDLLKVFHPRRRWTRFATQDTGEFGGTGSVELGNKTNDKAIADGFAEPKKQIYQDAASASAQLAPASAPTGGFGKITIDASNKRIVWEEASTQKRITIDLADMDTSSADVPDNLECKLRLTCILEGGVEKACYALRTEGF